MIIRNARILIYALISNNKIFRQKNNKVYVFLCFEVKIFCYLKNFLYLCTVFRLGETKPIV